MKNTRLAIDAEISTREQLQAYLAQYPDCIELRIDFVSTSLKDPDILCLPERIQWFYIREPQQSVYKRHSRSYLFANIYFYNEVLRNFHRCLEYVESVIRDEPLNLDALFMKAESLRMLGRLDEALPLLQEIARLNPQYPAALASVYAVYRARAQWTEAMSVLALLSRLTDSKNLPKGLRLSAIELKLMFLERLPSWSRVRLLEHCCAICLSGDAQHDAALDVWVEVQAAPNQAWSPRQFVSNFFYPALRPYHRECLLAAAQNSPLDPVTRLPIAHYYQPTG